MGNKIKAFIDNLKIKILKSVILFWKLTFKYLTFKPGTYRMKIKFLVGLLFYQMLFLAFSFTKFAGFYFLRPKDCPKPSKVS